VKAGVIVENVENGPFLAAYNGRMKIDTDCAHSRLVVIIVGVGHRYLFAPHCALRAAWKKP
jgi:hypothetical protein